MSGKDNAPGAVCVCAELLLASTAAVTRAAGTGVKTVNGKALEVPPPGAGVTTVT